MCHLITWCVFYLPIGVEQISTLFDPEYVYGLPDHVDNMCDLFFYKTFNIMKYEIT